MENFGRDLARAFYFFVALALVLGACGGVVAVKGCDYVSHHYDVHVERKN
jgi:hypothetical protein